MIYLSWSIAQLIAGLVVGLVVFCVQIYFNREFFNRYTLFSAVAPLVIIALLAFNVGTRQEHLQRASFDAKLPAALVERVDRKTLSRTDVKLKFENTVKEKTE